jgi:hypothetical protein
VTEPAALERTIIADAPVIDWLDRLCLSRLHTHLNEAIFPSVVPIGSGTRTGPAGT